MPSASKNINCANTSNPYTLSVSWSESSPSITNNTSVISASGSMSASNVSFAANPVYTFYLRLYWHDNRTNSDTLIATSAGFNSCGMGYGSRSVSGSITVTHKDDGSLSGYVRMDYSAPTTSGGWAPASNNVATENTALTTIARASDFTINAGSALLGSSVNIQISRKSTNFTHKVSYQFAGSSSTTVTSNAATSATFTPPLSLASNIPNTTTGTLTVTVTTYNGSTQIGSAVSKSVNLNLPTSVVPTMGTPTTARIDNGVPSGWGVYVRSISVCKVTINGAAGIYGSTIKSYQITGGGINSSSSTAQTPSLPTAGTVTFTCTITDSRGRTASKSVSINVVDYSPPSIAVSAVRCISNGTPSSEGTYLKVTVDYSYASVSSKNSITSKKVTCNGVSNTSFGDNAGFVLAANVSIGRTYVLTATVTDALGKTATASINIGTSTRIMNVRSSKDGLAIGKFSEKAGFEVGWPAYFENSSQFDGIAKFPGGTYVHAAYGTAGQSGVVKIARITISAGRRNSPIRIGIVQRRRRAPAIVSIAFESSSGSDPGLLGSNFTFEGDDDYSIYILKAATSTWDLYVLKSEDWDAIGVIDYGADFNYMTGVNIEWTNVQTTSIPAGATKCTNVNNLTRFASAGIDPNTTLYPLILTNNAHRPSSVSTYWYIQTFFYDRKTATSNRYQIAMPYSSDKESIYHRFYHDSTNSWGKWRRLRNADEGWQDCGSYCVNGYKTINIDTSEWQEALLICAVNSTDDNNQRVLASTLIPRHRFAATGSSYTLKDQGRHRAHYHDNVGSGTMYRVGLDFIGTNQVRMWANDAAMCRLSFKK